MVPRVAPKITLYTSYVCAYSHRVQITLRELKLDFDTVVIDLRAPRTPEYLKVNPRGIVPALEYNGTIITESGIISQFLADAHPSHLEKTSSERGGALQRANINFFVDTYFGKVNGFFWSTLSAGTDEKEKKASLFIDALVKEIEPLLDDANPFFGGASQLTLAEALTGSFILRVLALSKYEVLLPKSWLKDLERKAPNFWKWANTVIKEESVLYMWDEKEVAEWVIETFAKPTAVAK